MVLINEFNKKVKTKMKYLIILLTITTCLFSQSSKFKILEKRAIEGDSVAQFNLGENYKFGYTVIANIDSAFVWYNKSALKGYTEAEYTLGKMYKYGRGVEKDTDKTVEWYTKAAKKGHEYAISALSNLRKIDSTIAFKWTKVAAEKGSVKSQANLGIKYFIGDGTAKSKKKAKYWLSKASKDGSKYATAMLKKFEL